jgi:glucose-1-phosphate cytidylyltransferase
MKVVILAGGFGSRLSEETKLRPKPLIDICGKPLLWHIMKIYSFYGFNDFIICAGYLGEMIDNYFLNNQNILINNKWNVKIIDTGKKTNTGGRIKSIYNEIKQEDYFCMTYGDGLANVNIKKLVDFHLDQKSLCTITCVKPPARYGSAIIEENKVIDFREKIDSGGFINGGFFVMSPKVIDYINNDRNSFEFDVLPKLAKLNSLTAYKHYDFWYAVDTIREKSFIENLWNTKKAKWKIWED